MVWLIHQYRQAYDQFGTAYSDLTASPEDRRTREVIFEIDRVGLSEARRVFANSRTVAARLLRFNGIPSEPLYHPPPLDGRYRAGPAGDAVLWVGRLDSWKRPGLLLEALPHAPDTRAIFLGRGPERERLERRAQELGIASRVRWIEQASDEELLSLYAQARIVSVTASGEDLGYVPLEAFLSGKPVLTTEDAGGPLEFVRNGDTGIVVAPRAEALGVALRLAWSQTETLAAMGEAGRRAAARLNWDEPIRRLLARGGAGRARGPRRGRAMSAGADPLRRVAAERGRILAELGVRAGDARWTELEAEAIAGLITPAVSVRLPRPLARWVARLRKLAR